MGRRNQRGFTLIEVLVTVVIIGIVASIAIPNYTRYIVRSARAEAQAEMMKIANLQQQYLMANRAYGNTGALAYTIPNSLASKYTPTITSTPATASSPPSFLITFTPVAGSAQASDGTLTLNSDGVKTGTW